MKELCWRRVNPTWARRLLSRLARRASMRLPRPEIPAEAGDAALLPLG
jgi:hypothetical protein